MTLTAIAEQHRVPCRRTGLTGDDELIVAGRRGHLWMDDSKLMIAYTDDPAGCAGRGPKRPLTKMQKTYAIQKLGPALVRVTQMAECEFCGQLADDYAAVERAIKVLGIRRFKIDKGISKPFPTKAYTVATFSANDESPEASR